MQIHPAHVGPSGLGAVPAGPEGPARPALRAAAAQPVGATAPARDGAADAATQERLAAIGERVEERMARLLGSGSLDSDQAATVTAAARDFQDRLERLGALAGDGKLEGGALASALQRTLHTLHASVRRATRPGPANGDPAARIERIGERALERLDRVAAAAGLDAEGVATLRGLQAEFQETLQRIAGLFEAGAPAAGTLADELRDALASLRAGVDGLLANDGGPADAADDARVVDAGASGELPAGTSPAERIDAIGERVGERVGELLESSDLDRRSRSVLEAMVGRFQERIDALEAMAGGDSVQAGALSEALRSALATLNEGMQRVLAAGESEPGPLDDLLAEVRAALRSDAAAPALYDAESALAPIAEDLPTVEETA